MSGCATVNQETLETLQKRLEKAQKKAKKVKKSEKSLKRLKEQNANLKKDLSELKQVKTRLKGENLVITLPEKILFGLGKSEIKSKSKSVLDDLADIILEYPSRPVMVQGHTDDIPVKGNWKYPTNWHLSAARAVSVVNYLVDRHDMNPKRFVAAGYGKHHPVAPNDTAENRQKNRRVEIVLYPPKLPTKDFSSIR